jgi:hypothetical protein
MEYPLDRMALPPLLLFTGKLPDAKRVELALEETM